MKETIILCLAILGVIILESIALFKGIDGSLFMTSLFLIGGLGGYELKDMQEKIKKIKKSFN